MDLGEEERGVGEVAAVREGGEGEELAYGIGAAVEARGDEEGVGWEELVQHCAAYMHRFHSLGMYLTFSIMWTPSSDSCRKIQMRLL